MVDLEFQFPEVSKYAASRKVALDGEGPSAQHKQSLLYYAFVEENYFQTLSIPLFLGHGFPPSTGQPEHFVILSESAARLLWPAQNPIGHSLRLGATDERARNLSELSADGPAYQAISFVGVSLLFLAIALVAAYPPSRRAMRVDSVVALRHE